MTDFGDYENDDALDTAPADAEQVARKLHALRHARQREIVEWETLDDTDRQILVDIMAHLIAWLRRQGGMR